MLEICWRAVQAQSPREFPPIEVKSFGAQMINLAALKYREVVDAVHGPIVRMEVGKADVLGKLQFVANAYLKAGLTGERGLKKLFSPASASGTAGSQMVARFMAISEALERWAHWQLHDTEEGKKYGFGIDPSSNGLAAFPGLFRRQVRMHALLEASERFNLMHWWEGRLIARETEAPWPHVCAVTIASEAPGITVILYRQLPDRRVAYGHAASLTFESACWKAAIEMERHAMALTTHPVVHAGASNEAAVDELDPIERRAVFFASEEGHELFLERLGRSIGPVSASPKMVFDGPVLGPWTRYVDVWRVVYEPPSDRFLNSEENYFLW